MKHIVITGATGGLGQALALAYAGPETILSLTGRREDILHSLSRQCRELGAETWIQPLDLRRPDDLRHWIQDVDERCPVNVVIANAGVSSSIGPQGQPEAIDDVRRVFAVNTMAVVETIHPLAESMRMRGAGRIALVSSLGGWYGMPCSPAYSASKAAARVYGQALRSWLRPSGITVTVISPGYVQSTMSRRYQGQKPFLISAPHAARRIQKGLEQGKPEISFPLPLVLGMSIMNLIPSRVADGLLRRFFAFHVLPDPDSPLFDSRAGPEGVRERE